MKRAIFLINLMALLVCVGPASTGDQSDVGLSWAIKPVAIEGRKLPRLVDKSCDAIAVIAYRGDKSEPIPFQIDPVNEKGKYILAPPSGDIRAWPNSRPFGPRDELVFMAFDAGDRSTSIKGGSEISITDPVSGETKYVYIFAVGDSRPPRSPRDYVRYESDSRSDRVVTDHFIQGFAPDGVFFEDLFILPTAGGTGVDIMDKLKLRSEVMAVSGKVSVKRTEADFVSRVIGLRDGPVRVIRRNATNMSLFLGLKSPSVIVDGIFTRDMWAVPSELRVPFRMDMMISGIRYVQGCDLDLAAGPFSYHSNNNPAGVDMDGRMTPAEKSLGEDTTLHEWALLTGKSGTIAYRAFWPKNSAVKPTPFYMDDAKLADPPEYETGLHMFGFNIRNLLELRGDSYRLNIVNYVIPDFDGDVKSTVASITAQFAIKVDGGP